MATATWANTETVVSKLILRGKQLDSLVAPQRLSRLLQSIDLQPPGFPPEAILCIRRYRTQLPASWLTQSQVTVPSHEWQQRVQGSIDELRRRAARPVVDAVSPTAEAVWFADRAELLACLAKDWRDGTLLSRWWWQSLFPQRDYNDLFLRAWQDSPEYIPSTLHLLARMGQLLSVTRQLSTEEAVTLRRQVEHTFGLTQLAGEVSLMPAAATADRSRSGTIRQRLWRTTAPELLSGGLSLEQERFAGIGLMLHRVPSVVRSTAFGRQYHQYYRAIADRRAVPSTDAFAPPTPREPSIQFLNVPTVDGTSLEATDPSPTTITRMRSRDSANAEETSENQDRQRSPSQRIRSAQELDRHESAVEPPLVRQRRATSLMSKSEKPAAEQCWAESEAQVLESEYGGVFYLINVGLFLELYGDFTQPLRPGISLPIWDFLALTGERLIGPALHEDPLWPLLSHLSGRQPDQPPGAMFDPPTEWHVPPEWLKPFSDKESWRWAWTEGRLRVWHSSDFVLLDCAMEDEPSTDMVRTLLQDYRSDGALVQIDDPSLTQGLDPLDQWLAWLLPYLRARIARALACELTDDWPTLLFKHRASISFTDTKLDVTFSLTHHPLAIRIAGLDRDPGWVPAAGRFIAFHYRVP